MDPLVSTALEAAEAAARIHLLHFGRFRVDEVQEKGRSDFVSMVDLEAQEAAAAVIRLRHPGHQILAEEEMGSRDWPRDGSHLWIVDPLDGTTNYLHRHPMFAASVAVGRRLGEEDEDEEEEGTEAGEATEGAAWKQKPSGRGPVLKQKPSGRGPVLKQKPSGRGPAPWRGAVLEACAVVAPRTGERWWARKGAGAWKNGQPVRVSGLRSLKSALVGTGFPFKEPHLLPRFAQQFQRVLPASGGVRRGGSAALDLCFLAEGIFDAFWEEEYLAPWDIAAGLLLVQEAGGVATRLDGRPFDLDDGSVMAANSPGVLAELGAALGGGPQDT
jgi:myo-inositol-1(or 4)-monophosphatase